MSDELLVAAACHKLIGFFHFFSQGGNALGFCISVPQC